MTRLLCLLLALLALPALADERKIREALEPKLGGAKVEGIQATPVPSLFEVRLQTPDGPRIVYSDEKGNYLFTGRLIDLKNDRDLTEERMRKLTAIDFGKLPLDLAVKVQRGNGRRVLAIFSDPYCPACQRFEEELVQVDDITIYYFMYPVIRPELAGHSRAVWCAADRSKAWLDLALRRKPPAGAANCQTPIEKVVELGKQLRVNSTPTLILTTGEVVRGGQPAEKLRATLDDAGRKR